MAEIDGNTSPKSDIIGKLVWVWRGIVLRGIKSELVREARDEEIICGGRRWQIRVGRRVEGGRCRVARPNWSRLAMEFDKSALYFALDAFCTRVCAVA